MKFKEFSEIEQLLKKINEETLENKRIGLIKTLIATAREVATDTALHFVSEQYIQPRKNVSSGLYSYPVLMASDIIIYNSDIVPVGEDQVQHVEFARTLARKFDSQFEKIFNEPQAMLTKFKRVMSLTNPIKKMSKTDSANSYIAILDSESNIRKKIASAVTDDGPGKEMSPGVKNLFELLESFAEGGVYKKYLGDYNAGSLKYSELKPALADAIIEKLKPIQKKYTDLMKNPDQIWKIIEQGNEKALEVSKQTYEKAKNAMGL
jgi:tryptophanyl-tRNA synthetase